MRQQFAKAKRAQHPKASRMSAVLGSEAFAKITSKAETQRTRAILTLVFIGRHLQHACDRCCSMPQLLESVTSLKRLSVRSTSNGRVRVSTIVCKWRSDLISVPLRRFRFSSRASVRANLAKQLNPKMRKNFRSRAVSMSAAAMNGDDVEPPPLKPIELVEEGNYVVLELQNEKSSVLLVQRKG